ncbi:MAG: gliding motility-associated C-terminal domain-containing protein [Ginsengibacter sp.]
MKFFYGLFFFLLLFTVNITRAQLCNGGLSDPIVNVTFGNTPAMLTGFTTTYHYVRGCPAKGEYTLSNLIFGCGETPAAHSWYMLAGDHTGGQNGQYMLVNAESRPGTIHQDTATGLCGNTIYQYSAWIANVMQKFACGGNPVLPNITFTVSTLSGQVLQTYNTGDLPIEDARIWKQFGLSFTTPVNVGDVILSLSTDPVFGCGSAFVVDDITLSMCGPKLAVTLDGLVQDGNVCADYTNPFVLNGMYDAGFNDPVFQWQQSADTGVTWSDIAGATTLAYQIPHRLSGVVIYRLAMAERPNINSLHCRIVSNKIYTEIHPVPNHNAPQNVLGCKDKDLQLPQADPSALSINWSGPHSYNSTNPKSTVPDIQFADTGIYVLRQGFYFGCTSIDTFNVNVFPSTTISVNDLYTICEGKSINFSASGQGAFKWTPSTGLSNDAIPNPVATPKDSVTYKVIVTNSYGCQDSADVVVNVLRNPMVDAGPDKEILKGDSIILDGSAKGTSINYAWSPLQYMDDNKILDPTVFPPSDMQYLLSATSNVGCGTSSSAVKVKVFNAIDIPNAFTPNGDGINDVFKISAPGNYKIKKFIIYNRWGKRLFNLENASIAAWDGTYKGELQPVDAYVYYFDIQLPNGRQYINKGTLFLIR